MSGQFGTGAEVSRRLMDTSALVPKCLGSEVSWVRSVLTPPRTKTKTEIYLWNTFITPVVSRVIQTLHERSRHTDFPVTIGRWSSFQQQDLSRLVAACESVRQDTSSRTGTDNDVVIFVDIFRICRRRPSDGSVFPVVCKIHSKIGTRIRHRHADFPLLKTAVVMPLQAYKTIPYLHFIELPIMKHDLPVTMFVRHDFTHTRHSSAGNVGLGLCESRFDHSSTRK